MSERIIVREVNKAYEIPVKVLCERAGFSVVTLLDRDETPIQSKSAWLKQGISASIRLIPKIGDIRKAEKVLLIGNYMSLFSVFLNKVHVIHPETLYWWGFQIRGESMQKLLKGALGILYSDNVKFIIFSQYERDLYASRLGIGRGSFIPVSYGDWQNIAAKPSDAGDYYFSGGYSNRDYAGLLEAWKNIGRPLVIAGSKNNQDLFDYTCHPDDPSVTVRLDTAPDVFQDMLAGSKACILPFVSNTGASGQTVALRAMKSGKILISRDIDAMKEYVEDGVTGFLIHDMKRGLPPVIDKIESDPEMVKRMIKAQTDFFNKNFSYDVITGKLADMFKEEKKDRNIAIVVLFMNNFGQKGFYQSQELGLAEALKRKGASVDVYKCTSEEDRVENSGFPVYYRKCAKFGTHALFRPERFFKKKYDTIIAFSDTQLIVPSLYRYCMKNGIRFIPYVGNTESVAFTMKNKKKVMDTLFSMTTLKTYRKCDQIFCKNHYTIRELRKMGLPESRLVLAPVGINLSMINRDYKPEDASMLRKEMGYAPEDKVLLFVGRMVHEKRPLDMFRILDRLGSDVKLILIGDGILADKAEKMAEMFSGRVRYIRKVPYENMWKYYAAADYFVNLWDHEIFGMAIVEAIYYLTPAFLIDAPGPEVITEGMENSFLCKDIDEIVSRIKSYRYNEDSLLRDRERLLQNCSWDRFTGALSGQGKDAD